MLIAHHLIMTAYGWWLPNDPRGSSSHDIRVEPVGELGELHIGRKTQQPLSRELRQFYLEAEQVLAHPLLAFDDEDIAEIAASFADTIRQRRYTCYAAAIMSDHVHLLVRVHRDKAEAMIEAFQSASRLRLRGVNRRSLIHPTWGGPGWKVFVLNQRHLLTVIRYIENNPIKAHRPPQRWEFVTPYDGWLPGLHPERRPPR